MQFGYVVVGQYQVNTCGSAVKVGAVWLCCCGCSTKLILAVALWVQYQVNTSGDVVAVGAVWVFCFGCSTIVILVVAL